MLFFTEWVESERIRTMLEASCSRDAAGGTEAVILLWREGRRNILVGLTVSTPLSWPFNVLLGSPAKQKQTKKKQTKNVLLGSGMVGPTTTFLALFFCVEIQWLYCRDQNRRNWVLRCYHICFHNFLRKRTRIQKHRKRIRKQVLWEKNIDRIRRRHVYGSECWWEPKHPWNHREKKNQQT